MKFTVFYSWQSIAENGINRNFIEDSIDKAIKRANTEEHGEIDMFLDRDTKEVSGSPSIIAAIFEKIESCDVFVADISLVVGDRKTKQRLSPNPNVLIELGYAIKVLGWDRIIMIANEAFANNDEDYPFDIRQHRRIKYSLENVGQDRSEARKHVQNVLTEQIQLIVNKPLRTGQETQPILVPSWLSRPLLDSGDYVAQQPLKLFRAISEERVFKRLDYDVASLDKINGNLDPKWNDKKTAYVEQAEEFKAILSDPIEARLFSYLYSDKSMVEVKIKTGNTGGKPASKVRMEFQMPDWLYVSEDLPDVEQSPKYPQIPVPKRPKTQTERSMERLIGSSKMSDISGTFFNSYDLSPRVKKATALTRLTVENGLVKYYCEELMHKSSSFPREHSLYFFAYNDAPLGVHKIMGRVICNEFSDYHDVVLEIQVDEMDLRDLMRND